MPLSVSVDHGPRFLQITCVGPAKVAAWFGAFSMAAAVASRDGYTRVLVDMLTVDFELTPVERQEVGSFGANLLAGFERVACVLPRVLYTGEAERTAQRLGLAVRSFEELEPAMR